MVSRLGGSDTTETSERVAGRARMSEETVLDFFSNTNLFNSYALR